MMRFFALVLLSIVWIPTSCKGPEGDLAAAPLFAGATPERAAAPPIEWIDFQKALALADSSGKVVLVDVYASWCPWCAKMQDSVYTQALIKEYVAKHFVTARLNVEQVDDEINFKGYKLNSSQLASGFGAESTPTTVFLTSTGDYITRLPGYLDAEGFMRVLTYIGSEAYKHKSFEQFMSEAAG
ncbi:MAG: thioredoxin fold domain-containing protein [Rhodothermales bacterium]|nr:thioredoxin fold domain-containing protein [Rhodothermales bacterium]